MHKGTESRVNQAQQLKISELETAPLGYGAVILNKDRFVEVLDETQESKTLSLLKSKLTEVKQVLGNPRNDTIGIVNIDANGDTISLRKDVLLSDIEQILEAQTIERAQHYLRRLKTGINEIKTSQINDINLLCWKEYDDVITDSLWVLQKRDNSGAHVAEYWGNFIPQIPHQMMIRYTKKGDWVLGTFVKTGTFLHQLRESSSNCSVWRPSSCWRD